MVKSGKMVKFGKIECGKISLIWCGFLLQVSENLLMHVVSGSEERNNYLIIWNAIDAKNLIGIHSMQGWTATTRHGVTRKEAHKKDYRIQKICLERTYS